MSGAGARPCRRGRGRAGGGARERAPPRKQAAGRPGSGTAAGVCASAHESARTAVGDDFPDETVRPSAGEAGAAAADEAAGRPAEDVGAARRGEGRRGRGRRPSRTRPGRPAEGVGPRGGGGARREAAAGTATAPRSPASRQGGVEGRHGIAAREFSFGLEGGMSAGLPIFFLDCRETHERHPWPKSRPLLFPRVGHGTPGRTRARKSTYLCPQAGHSGACHPTNGGQSPPYSC